MRTQTKIRKKVNPLLRRRFRYTNTFSYYSTNYMELSIVRALCATDIMQKAEAMHAIIEAAPTNADMENIIKIDED